jgi:pyridoxal biosynthesis lyase PdxS
MMYFAAHVPFAAGGCCTPMIVDVGVDGVVPGAGIVHVSVSAPVFPAT